MKIILKDNKFNHVFCDNWTQVKKFLELWHSMAQRMLVKAAIAHLIKHGDKKYLECADLHK